MPITPTTFSGPSGPLGPTAGVNPAPGAAQPIAQPYAAQGLSPQQAASAAQTYYGPQQQYLDTIPGQISGALGLNGQQLADQVSFAQNQYGTGLQNLQLDRQNIDAQRIGLAGDNRYLNDLLGISRGANFADRRYATRDSQIAQQLFQSLMGQNSRQGTLYRNQLAQQILAIGYKSRQAKGSATNDTQQLAQQVGGMGAYGSRGAGQRQGFIDTSLANALGGFRTDVNLANVGYGLNRSQLAQAAAGYLSTRNNAFNQNQRRQAAANNADRRAYAEYAHGRSGTQLSENQLRIAASRLGVSQSQLANILQNAINSASLGYGSGLLQANQGLASYANQQGQLQQNQQSLANQLAG